MKELEISEVRSQAEAAFLLVDNEAHRPISIKVKIFDLRVLARYLDRDLRRKRQNFRNGMFEEYPSWTREDLNSVLLERLERLRSWGTRRLRATFEINFRELEAVTDTFFGQMEQMGKEATPIFEALACIHRAFKDSRGQMYKPNKLE